MTLDQAEAMLRRHAPMIGERLARVAMEWTVASLGEHGAVTAALAADLPAVKMFDAAEMVEHAATEYGDEDTVTVAYVTDGMATEYLRLDPETGEIETRQE